MKILFKELHLGIFWPKCGANLVHKCRSQNLTVTVAMLLCCYCKCLAEWLLTLQSYNLYLYNSYHFIIEAVEKRYLPKFYR